MKVKELESAYGPSYQNCDLNKLKDAFPTYAVGLVRSTPVIAVSFDMDDYFVYLFELVGVYYRKVREFEVDRPQTVDDLGRFIIALNH